MKTCPKYLCGKAELLERAKDVDVSAARRRMWAAYMRASGSASASRSADRYEDEAAAFREQAADMRKRAEALD
jgi:hypothetical protein